VRQMKFALRPFPAKVLPPGIGITGSVGWDAGKFSIRYELRAAASEIAVPEAADMPNRRDGLWKDTCFEFFLGPENADRYWEFNLSPSGHWNVYRFTSYREGMQEEQAVAALPFVVVMEQDSLALTLNADLSGSVGRERTLDAGIAAVVKLADGTLTYWALAHPGPRPDFHRRDSFILKLQVL
jgi:hypothetical protein